MGISSFSYFVQVGQKRVSWTVLTNKVQSDISFIQYTDIRLFLAADACDGVCCLCPPAWEHPTPRARLKKWDFDVFLRTGEWCWSLK